MQRDVIPFHDIGCLIIDGFRAVAISPISIDFSILFTALALFGMKVVFTFILIILIGKKPNLSIIMKNFIVKLSSVKIFTRCYAT